MMREVSRTDKLTRGLNRLQRNGPLPTVWISTTSLAPGRCPPKISLGSRTEFTPPGPDTPNLEVSRGRELLARGRDRPRSGRRRAAHQPQKLAVDAGPTPCSCEHGRHRHDQLPAG